MPGPEKVYFIGGNPIYVDTAETSICVNRSITVGDIVWQGITADGATLVLATDDSSAAGSNILSRKGKQDIPMSVIPRKRTFSNLYVRTMSSGFLEINLE